MDEYRSPHTGEQLDEGISRSIRGGEIDITHVIKTYGSLAEIGLSAGIETMTMIAQSLGDNSRVVYSAAGGNDVADGSAYPVKNGSAVRNGVLEAHRVNANLVFFEYANSENVWVGFYNGSWSGWAQVYDTKNKPTAAEVGAVPNTGGDISGRLNVSGRVRGAYFEQNPLNYGTPNEFGQYLDLHVAGSTADYDFRLFLDAQHNLYCQKPGGTAELILHTGNAAASGMGGGLTLLKTLTVEADEVSELEFQLTAAELSKYKRFVIFPKLETEYSASNSSPPKLYLEAPTFSDGGTSVTLGALSGYPSNSVAFVSVGTNYTSYGWSLRMMTLNDADDCIESDSSASTSSYPNPTTGPITFRLYTYSSYPFIKGGTVSIMGVN